MFFILKDCLISKTLRLDQYEGRQDKIQSKTNKENNKN